MIFNFHLDGSEYSIQLKIYMHKEHQNNFMPCEATSNFTSVFCEDLIYDSDNNFRVEVGLVSERHYIVMGCSGGICGTGYNL